jgi:hypothetical protein
MKRSTTFQQEQFETLMGEILAQIRKSEPLGRKKKKGKINNGFLG